MENPSTVSLWKSQVTGEPFFESAGSERYSKYLIHQLEELGGRDTL